jgi:hypothetical protein
MDVSYTHCCQKDEINWLNDWLNGRTPPGTTVADITTVVTSLQFRITA